MSNLTGAETSYVDITLRQPEQEMSTQRMEQVELRLRYVLDNRWLATRIGGGVITPTWIQSTVDPTIATQMLARWDRYLTPLSSTEVGIRYIVAYQRNVPR